MAWETSVAVFILSAIFLFLLLAFNIPPITIFQSVVRWFLFMMALAMTFLAFTLMREVVIGNALTNESSLLTLIDRGYAVFAGFFILAFLISVGMLIKDISIKWKNANRSVLQF